MSADIRIDVDTDGRLIVTLPEGADARLDIKRVDGEWHVGKNSRIGSRRIDLAIGQGRS